MLQDSALGGAVTGSDFGPKNAIHGRGHEGMVPERDKFQLMGQGGKSFNH